MVALVLVPVTSDSSILSHTSAIGNNTQVPFALNFEHMREDINMDMGGNNDEGLLITDSMCTVETPTVIELEEELSITGHGFTNNIITIPTTITATNQSNGEFTPVRNGSPNRQSTQERRNTTTTTNNSYSALQTTSTIKESNNNTTNSSAKGRHDQNKD
jgi:hypothetical protein